MTCIPMGPRRDWGDARRAHEGAGCRVCGDSRVELAHTVGRAFDAPGKVRYVHPLSVVPLCRRHHVEFDAHTLDLFDWLYPGEWDWAVGRVGWGQASRRIRGRAWLMS